MKSSVVRSAVLVLLLVGVVVGCGGGSSVLDAGSHRHGGRPEHDDAAAQQQLHPPGRHAELGGRVRAAVHAVRRRPSRVEVRAEDHPRRRDNPGAGEAARGGAGRAGTGLRQRRLLRRPAVHRPGRPAADRRVLHARRRRTTSSPSCATWSPGTTGRSTPAWWATDLRVLYRRTDLVPEAPRTWDELQQAAKEAERAETRRSTATCSTAGAGRAPRSTTWPTSGARAASWWTSEGKPIFGEEPNREYMLNMFEFLKENVDSGASPQTGRDDPGLRRVRGGGAGAARSRCSRAETSSTRRWRRACRPKSSRSGRSPMLPTMNAGRARRRAPAAGPWAPSPTTPRRSRCAWSSPRRSSSARATR